MVLVNDFYLLTKLFLKMSHFYTMIWDKNKTHPIFTLPGGTMGHHKICNIIIQCSSLLHTLEL